MKKKLGLYIHIPFCRSKCFYCDFYSVIYDQGLIDQYIKHMGKELLLYSQRYREHYIIDTIYIGGGTPTILLPFQFTSLFQKIHDHFDVTEDAEITTEANPESLTEEHLKVFRKININRISLGVQSFHDKVLKLINRRTGQDEIIRKIKLLKKYRFPNISLDLIFGLPEQNTALFKQDLKLALSFHPQHLSLYSLILDKKTPAAELYARKKEIFPDDEEMVKDYLYANHELKKHGFIRYEISNFCKKGFESRHNLKYWRQLPYLGIGASATSTIEENRWTNVYHITDYIEKLKVNDRPVMKLEKLTPIKLFNEKVMLKLRLREGLPIKDLDSREKRMLGSKKGAIRELTRMGLLKSGHNRLTIPLKGIMLSNEVISWLMY
ncbi:MAG: radical SAM family heme chaperone HemW [bacterium]|nr:radical SAM family heme chaperone HemW [bacterium]